MFPPKSFDFFPPEGGCSEGLDAFRFFFKPGKVTNAARGQLKKENEHIFLPPFTLENLVSRDGFGRPVPRQPAHFPYLG